MVEFFEILKLEDLEIRYNKNSSYLIHDNQIMLEAKGNYKELLNTLKEMNTIEYSNSPGFKRVSELCILSLLYRNSRLIENSAFSNLHDRAERVTLLEKRIKEIVNINSDICINNLLVRSGINNTQSLIWDGNRFVSRNFKQLEDSLKLQLNQTEFIIDTNYDTQMLFNVGDIFENMESDYYVDCKYFEHRTVNSPAYLYNELIPLKYELMLKVNDGTIKIKFGSSEIKKEVIHNFIDNLLYCTVRLDYYEDIDNEIYETIKKFIDNLVSTDIVGVL